MTYKFMLRGGEKLECGCCNYQAPLCPLRLEHPRAVYYYCDVCAGSMASTLSRRDPAHIGDLAGVIGYAANAILEQLGAFNGVATEEIDDE